jgi:23S rRNA (guanosine2251-2'-O)-methyltransferase
MSKKEGRFKQSVSREIRGKTGPGSKKDTLWLYGIHPCRAALENQHRQCLRLVLSRKQTDFIKGMRLSLQPEMVDPSYFREILPADAVHQGVALEVKNLESVSLEDICENSEENIRVVVLDQVTDPHNVGAILRSAAAFGASAVIMTEMNSPDLGGVLAKAASGALEKVPVILVTNLKRALDHLKKANFWCVGFDEEGSHVLGQRNLTGRLVLVLGAEGPGLRRLTHESCDVLVRLPTTDSFSTLNVSNAAAVALYEMQRCQLKI